MEKEIKDFLEELKYNEKINIVKGIENRVDIKYVIERLESSLKCHQDRFNLLVNEIKGKLDRIEEAYRNNVEDMKQARKEDDYEEQARCDGYEMALEYVLSLFNIYIKK